MQIIENQTLYEGRALYGLHNALVCSSRFDGKADDESALKESHQMEVQNCFFHLQWPLWHGCHGQIIHSNMTESGRAALQYDRDLWMETAQKNGMELISEYPFFENENLKVNYRNMISCTIQGPQFFCRCEDMMRDPCVKVHTDLCLERNIFDAVLNSSIESINNPMGRSLQAKDSEEVIFDLDEMDPKTAAIVTTKE